MSIKIKHQNYYGFDHEQVQKKFEGEFTYLGDICFNSGEAPWATYRNFKPNKEKNHKDYLLLKSVKDQIMVSGINMSEITNNRYQNAILCLKCGEVIYSAEVHNYRTCSCNNCSVDGGKSYFKYSVTSEAVPVKLDFLEQKILSNIDFHVVYDWSYQNKNGLQIYFPVKRERQTLKSGRLVTHLYWLCKCTCGKLLLIKNSLLNKREILLHSCGCQAGKGVQIKKGQAAFNITFKQFLRSCEARNIDNELTKKEFKKITSQNCHYCGYTPAQKVKYKGNGIYLYNGIDRIDNTKGYLKDNIVPCCKKCNFMKGKLSKEDFLTKIKEIYNNLFK